MYLEELRKDRTETRKLFSNANKPKRERMVVRAFLRCIGESFGENEILTKQPEPVDVAFRSADFQIMDIVGKKKRGDKAKEQQRAADEAESILELAEPYTPTEPISIDILSRKVTDELSRKAKHYGKVGCSGLDALVYWDPGGQHIYPVEFSLGHRVVIDLVAQGWRSVSVLAVPYGITLVASPDAPEFLLERKGKVCKCWPDDKAYALFDA